MKARLGTGFVEGRWLGLLCVLLAFVVHLPALEGQAVLDDNAVFLENPVVQGPFSVKDIFSTNIFGGRAGYEKAGGYRPLTILTFHIGPADSLVFQRLLNLLMHGLAVWMLWLLGLELGLRSWASASGAFLFGVHPVHVDAIIPLNNRSDLLCTLLLFSSLLIWLRSNKPRSALVAVGLGFLAALSKEQGLLAPLFLAIPTLVWWRRLSLDGGGERLVSWRVLLIFSSLMLSLLALWLRYEALGGSLTGEIPVSDNPLVAAELPGRLLAPGSFLLKAISLLIWPMHLSADYTRDALTIPSTWASLSGWLGLMIFLLWGLFVAKQIWCARMLPALCFGGALLAYIVTSNLLVLASISFSERALYLPTAFLALGLGRLARPLFAAEGGALRLRIIAALALLCCLSGLSAMRVVDYRSNAAIAASSLQNTPRSSRLWTILGESLKEKKRLKEADGAYARALLYDPRSASALRGRGQVAFTEQRFKESADWHDRAIQASRGGLVGAYNDSCLAYLRSGSLPEALGRCQTGLSQAPNEAVLMTNLSRVYLAMGKIDDALEWAEAGYRRAPEKFYTLWHLLMMKFKSGDRPAAERLWKEAKKRKPGDPRLLQFAELFGFE